MIAIWKGVSRANTSSRDRRPTSTSQGAIHSTARTRPAQAAWKRWGGCRPQGGGGPIPRRDQQGEGAVAGPGPEEAGRDPEGAQALRRPEPLQPFAGGEDPVRADQSVDLPGERDEGGEEDQPQRPQE